MQPSRFWLWHAWLPAALFAAVLAATAAFDLDRRLADALFFDRADATWIGADRWWAVNLIHGGGAMFVRIAGLAVIVVWLAGFWRARLRVWRLEAAYVMLALIVCTSLVGGLKQLTGVDCPRDLAGYGGDRPYAPLLVERPAALPRGRCYPGSHASSGFALMAFYFALRRRRPVLSRGLLAAAIGIGIVFSVGQQARGAHFLSHDLAGAALAWFLALVIWQRLLESRSPDAPRWISSGRRVSLTNGARSIAAGHVRGSRAHPAHARRRRAGLRGVFQRLLPARLPLCAAAAQWRRRGDARRGPGDPRQGDAQDG